MTHLIAALAAYSVAVTVLAVWLKVVRSREHDAAINQTLELDDVMADNDRLKLTNEGLAAENSVIRRENEGLRAENVTLLNNSIEATP